MAKKPGYGSAQILQQGYGPGGPPKPPKPPKPAYTQAQVQASLAANPYATFGPSFGVDYMGGGGGGGWGQPERPTGRLVTPDYSGILGSFTADARQRFGAGLQARKAERLSNARSLINRLGIRDPTAALSKFSQYGLTEQDLAGAAANPWSELKALELQGRNEWQNAVANRAARGGYRSGGTIGARQRIDQELARREAALTEEALGGLSQGLQGEAGWEREQREAMEQSIAQQQAQLAAAYQPYWVWD